jgi:putative transposase
LDCEKQYKMEPKDKSKELNRKSLSWLKEQSIDLQIGILQNHLSICQIMINELLEEEVTERAGPRYCHQKPENGRYSRWGYNPGSVKIGDRRLKIDVPRLFDNIEENNIPLNRYEELKDLPEPTDQLLKGVLLGLSMRDYGKVIDHLGEGFGLSKSSISRSFIERTEEKLHEFETRPINHHKIIALFIDGKYLSKEQIIICLGVTINGDKVPLCFIQAATENSQPIRDMLEGLKNRGLDYSDGLLCVIDGSKGIRKAVDECFGEKAIIQRCQWHKQENILRYLPEKHHETVKRQYQHAINQDLYEDAKTGLLQLKSELKLINMSAARSLDEALDEILALHKLGLHSEFGRSFSTTNCIENLNSQLRKYVGKVKNWSISNERYRWIAAALLEIERRMRKIDNFEKLNEFHEVIKKEVKRRTLDIQISTKN